jgi:hypothetical protein
MKAKLIALCGLVVVATLALTVGKAAEKAHKLTTVSTRKMADSLHAVIAADRQAYLQLVQQGGTKEGSTAPVHARLLRHAAREIQKGGAEFSYTLRSAWPVDPANGPQTEAEQAGLARVMKSPAENYYVEEELGGRSYFTAVYADRATLPSCVACHNGHPQSPKRDFREGDVMGAIVVRVPLEF